ncbi:hypothetical protein DH09_10720 [Bacillaceae bacterium JMAK1]|nr:hypothetical protein DH09_10720 [Bacillaceae bacterium JMAK1]
MIEEQVSWSTLFQREHRQFCHACWQQIKWINDLRCSRCYRPQSSQSVCLDCVRWDKSNHWSNKLTRNVSLLSYNEWAQDFVARFKFRGDVVLVKAFEHELKRLYSRQFHHHLIVPIPLSEKRMVERGFNQSEALARCMATSINDVLTRVIHEEKTSKKLRWQRMAGRSRPFEVSEAGCLKSRDVVLVDDIYTTGATVRKAATVLLEAGATSVSSITLFRS